MHFVHVQLSVPENADDRRRLDSRRRPAEVSE